MVEGVVFRLKVFPKKRKFEVFDFEPEKLAMKVKTKSPALQGKANSEIEKEFAKLFETKTRIVKGFKSNKKEIWIASDRLQAIQKLKKLA